MAAAFPRAIGLVLLGVVLAHGERSLAGSPVPGLGNGGPKLIGGRVPGSVSSSPSSPSGCGATTGCRRQLRTSRSTAGVRGRSEMEQESNSRGRYRAAAGRNRSRRPAGGRGRCSRPAGARARHRAAHRAAGGARRAGSAGVRSPACGMPAALRDRTETHALEALGPIASEPRARERWKSRCGTSRNASSVPAMTRRNARASGRGEHRRRRNGRRACRTPATWWSSAALSAGRDLPADPQRDGRAEQATMKCRDALPRNQMVATSSG